MTTYGKSRFYDDSGPFIPPPIRRRPVGLMERGLGHGFGRSWACLGQLLGKLAACLGWSWAGRWVCGRQGLEIIEEKLEE